MSVNNFLPFCPTDTGTNLLSQSDYAADPQLAIGNQPGVARSPLANKALRQGTAIAAQLAQFLANVTGADILDDAVSAKLLAQMTASLIREAPLVSTFTASGAATYNLPYIFYIASGSATAAATYTNNSVTFTVKATVASATKVIMTGNGAPLVAGTLTKTSGTGDSTLTFYAVRAPIELEVEAVGAGGGGGGGGATGAGGTAGGNTTFGTTLIVCNGGGGGTGTAGDAVGGGTASLGTGPLGIAISGGYGSGGGGFARSSGGAGGVSGLGCAGGTASTGNTGKPPGVNSGGGGGGGGGSSTDGGAGGGGAGGYVRATITTVLSTYSVAVGAKGTGAAAGTSGGAGVDGSDGFVKVIARFQ